MFNLFRIIFWKRVPSLLCSVITDKLDDHVQACVWIPLVIGLAPFLSVPVLHLFTGNFQALSIHVSRFPFAIAVDLEAIGGCVHLLWFSLNDLFRGTQYASPKRVI